MHRASREDGVIYHRKKAHSPLPASVSAGSLAVGSSQETPVMASCPAFLPEPYVFVIFSHGLQGCLEAQGGQVRVSPACNASLPAQRWKWVSRNRLFNLGTMQCLGTGWPGTNTTASLGMYECDREALSLRWNCRTLGDQLSLLLGGRVGNTSKAGSPERGDQTRSGQWRIYGSDEDLCARPYYGERLPLVSGAWSHEGQMRGRQNLGLHRPLAVSSFIVMGSIWGSWRK